MGAISQSDTKFTDLPSRVQAAIREASPAAAADLDAWIHRPVPALGGRSVVQALRANAESGELEVIALCAAIKSRF